MRHQLLQTATNSLVFPFEFDAMDCSQGVYTRNDQLFVPLDLKYWLSEKQYIATLRQLRGDENKCGKYDTLSINFTEDVVA